MPRSRENFLRARKNGGFYMTINKKMRSGMKKMINHQIETLPSDKIAVFKKIAEEFGTPLYVYFEDELLRRLKLFQSISAPFGITVRYAIKANPTGAILSLLDKNGAHFDASTFNECARIIKGSGIEGSKIRLTSQEVQSPENLKYIAKNKILYTACSLLQLETYGKALPNTEVAVRFNIGIGSGQFAHISTGGTNSSFGIYQQRKEINSLLKKYNLTINTVHLHIGSGSDPEKQKEAIIEALKIVKDYPSVTVLNMGGGIKVALMNYEHATDIKEMGDKMSTALRDFEKSTSRKIKLEVEPGKALVANAGYVLTEIIDKVNTGQKGEEFLKVNGGMNMNARIPMYGAPHPIVTIPKKGKNSTKKYMVNGICCESGDVLTVKPWDPNLMEAREMFLAELGDLLVVGGGGAYVSSMAPGNYNSQQIHPEILVRKNGKLDLIRERQPLEDLWKYEKIPSDLK
jgi:diaminopimelate decarboxylase